MFDLILQIINIKCVERAHNQVVINLISFVSYKCLILFEKLFQKKTINKI
jgi:hypothetical protein